METFGFQFGDEMTGHRHVMIFWEKIEPCGRDDERMIVNLLPKGRQTCDFPGWNLTIPCLVDVKKGLIFRTSAQKHMDSIEYIYIYIFELITGNMDLWTLTNRYEYEEKLPNICPKNRNQIMQILQGNTQNQARCHSWGLSWYMFARKETKRQPPALPTAGSCSHASSAAKHDFTTSADDCIMSTLGELATGSKLHHLRWLKVLDRLDNLSE